MTSPPPSSELFAREFRAAREAVRPVLSMRALARLLHVTPGYLSRVETGHAPPLTQEMVLKAADLLQVDPGKLMLARALTAEEVTIPVSGSGARARLLAQLVVLWPSVSEALAEEVLSLISARIGTIQRKEGGDV